MIDFLLNLIFPTACVICDTQVLERRFGAACPNCWNTLEPIRLPICPKCGMPAAAIEDQCRRCRIGENVFDFARSAVSYNDTAKELVHRLKYSDRVSLAGPMAGLLRELLGNFSGNTLVPVPLHRIRERERGFNQAELIAGKLGLRVERNLLRRRKKTPTQTGLSRAERRRNLAAAFELQGDVRGKRIIVVDDVLTTGATVNEISRVLKRGGAERVEVLTFARVAESVSRREQPQEPVQ